MPETNEAPVSETPVDPIYEMQVEGGQYDDEPTETPVETPVEAVETPQPETDNLETPASAEPEQPAAPSPTAAVKPDAMTLRSAAFHNVDIAEWGDDVTGLQRHLRFLDRQAAERNAAPPKQEPKQPETPPAPSLVDVLKAEGRDDSDPIVVMARRLEAAEARAAQADERAQNSAEAIARREDEARTAAFESEVAVADPEFYGKGTVGEITAEAFANRKALGPTVMRLLESGAADSMSEAVRMARAKVHGDRLKNAVASEINSTFQKRKGTPTAPPNPPAATERLTGRAAAIAEMRKQIAENPELQDAGYVS